MAQLAPLSARAAIVSPRTQKRLSPLVLLRSETTRPSTTASSQVKGGGRLYTQSPIAGYTEAEMVREARLRIEHNKQRARLKKLLSTAAEGGAVVKMDDLILASELARMPMDRGALLSTPFATEHDGQGSPTKIMWKQYHASLEYPRLHGHGGLGNLPPLRSQRNKHQTFVDQQAAATAMGDAPAAAAASLVSDEMVYHHWSLLKKLMETRFSEIRRAFRLIDEDASGTCSRDELKFMLNAMFNLTIPEDVMDRIIDLADYDGDGEINFAEFCRLMTADNVLHMKQTLVADVSSWGNEDPAKHLVVNYGDMAQKNREMQAGGYVDGHHVKLRRTGPGLAALRKAHLTYKKAILARFDSMKDAFKAIDEDGSGTVRRSELRKFLKSVSKTIPDRVISALIDYCDSDGDAKTLSVDEFVEMMSAETLGSAGYDPNAAKVIARGS